MIGHFRTACRCEKYQPIDYPPPMRMKLITYKPSISTGPPSFSTVSTYGFREFQLISVDMSKALAEYEEV